MRAPRCHQASLLTCLVYTLHVETQASPRMACQASSMLLRPGSGAPGPQQGAPLHGSGHAGPMRRLHGEAACEPAVAPARAAQLRLKALVRTAGGGAELNALEPCSRAAEPPGRGLPPLS